MGTPRFEAVNDAYLDDRTVSKEALFRKIGWDDLIANTNYENTCAIRLSLALVGASLAIPGRMTIKKGLYRGRMIEPGQARLSQLLIRPSLLGQPEKYKGDEAARQGIGARRGIVSFWRIHPTWRGDTQGHIDVVWANEYRFLDCRSACFFSSTEVWFWPLK